MSAPPGWHQQPDGRERWWDGQQWTEHFRDPAPSDPTAPPTESYDSDRTQALDVDRTQQLPSQPPPGTQQGGYGQQGAYGDQGYTPPPVPTYPTQQSYSYPSGGGGVPAPGYATPGTYPPPQKQGMSGAAKGCLIAAVAVIVIVLIAVVGGIFLFRQAADEVSRQVESSFPTVLPSDFPSELPTELPSDGSVFGGDPVEVSVGDGFELPRATVDAGWTVEPGQFSSQVAGMTATFTNGTELPVAFSMSFQGLDQEAETFCTGAAENGSETADVACIPIFADVSGATSVVITPAF
jgi:hypothetical protein